MATIWCLKAKSIFFYGINHLLESMPLSGQPGRSIKNVFYIISWSTYHTLQLFLNFVSTKTKQNLPSEKIHLQNVNPLNHVTNVPITWFQID